MARVTEIQVNGVTHRIDADAETSLLTVLRERLDLTGSKYGCGEGQCGACTVLLDGSPRRSCITAVGDAAKKSITTIEGLENNGNLQALQQAFLDVGAMQCGYCTSGMIVSAAGLLKAKPNPSDEEIVRFMNGNICRCGTYPRILEAIRRAAKALREAGA